MRKAQSDWQKYRELLRDFVCDFFGIGSLFRFFKREWPAMKLHRAVLVVTAITCLVLGYCAHDILQPDKTAREQVNRSAHQRQILDRLGALLLEGENLQTEIEQSGEDGMSEDPIVKWSDAVTLYLSQALGTSYAVRVQSDAGIVPVFPAGNLQTEARDMWWKVHVRCVRLNQFLEELSKQPL